MGRHTGDADEIRHVEIRVGQIVLDGDLSIPAGAKRLVLFAHGSGSSRLSPRNRLVAGALNRKGIATLLFDLLTEEEEAVDMVTAELRFDIKLLAHRLAGATDWLINCDKARSMSIGYFGASTGAAAALLAATEKPEKVKAVVSRGGRPDLAGAGALPLVKCPTLLIVGGFDEQVIELNRKAMSFMKCEKELVIVPEASHLFEEEGRLEIVAKHATDWFLRYL
ncbi:MAG: dienelactone hydrolase family protein [Candidatus Micrarchaeota archaeon]|nr:dienelactone hydrolase family protein [Candidatus Micrarchaeota archaeon]MDE1824641.1 dienelactone hydrolase family protein [Candidatus Micrarchaeota archaeon]MDE1849706.1 dienelactone hydrolase family protein [Candidatus Micrarchaeota archaeon]